MEVSLERAAREYQSQTAHNTSAMKRKRSSPAMRAGILLCPLYRPNSRQLKGPHYHQYHDENHQQSGDFIHEAVKAGAVRVPIKKTVPTR